MKRWLEWVKANAMPLTTAVCLAVLVVLTELLVMGAVSSPLRVDWSEHLPALTAIGLGCFLALAGSLMAMVRVREHANNAEKALDSTNDGYWVLSPTGAFIDVNQGYCRMMGYTRDEVMLMSIADFEAVAKTEQIQAQIRGILKSGQQTFETRHRHRNGDWVDLEITATGVDGRYVVALLRNVSDRRLADRKIHHLAFFDELTGLPNRRLLQDRIEQALVSSSRGGCGGAIVFVDLDNFKLVNDSCGHAAGDALLVKVSECLRGCVRLGDTVARQGGDEFVLVLEGLSADPAQAALQAESIAEKCRRGLEQSFSVGASEFFVSASFGVALFFGSDSNFGVLLQRADTAMYQAKFGGRNRVVFFEPEMQRNLAARTQLESDLRHALSDKQLVLYLQPMVNSPGQLLGAEMLLRWQHPQRGLLTPGDFILAAEETGLILPIGAWVLESACRQLASWNDQASTRHLRLAVNISALQFMQPDFVDRLRDLLILGAFDPSNLTLELSERLVNKEPELVLAKVQQAQALGVSIAMDNFGTGLSSLTNLRRLPLRQLKIDQSFIRNVADDPNNMVVVQTIIAMAKALGLEVVAEGVESEANRAILEHNGCAAYQGYLFSRPLPLAEFEAKIRVGW